MRYGESVVLELADDSILKLSPKRYNYNVDGVCVPEISRGKIVTNKKKTIFYQIQKRVNEGGITQKKFETLGRKAEKEGCILQDCILDNGEIKQSNFGWYLNKKHERVPCVLDMGALKRTPERHFFEELINAAKKETISESDFTAHISNTLLLNNIMVNSNNTLSGYNKEYQDIVNEFIRLSNKGENPLNALQGVLRKHNLPPIKEYKL